MRIALQHPDTAKVRALVDAGANVNARDELGGTALHVAVNFRGEPDVIRLLIDRGANVNAPDTDGDGVHDGESGLGVCRPGGLASVTQVAQDCGFVDVSHLIRVFRSIHATTPEVWRRVQIRTSSLLGSANGWSETVDGAEGKSQ